MIQSAFSNIAASRTLSRAATAILLLAPQAAQAAARDGTTIDGAALSWPWALPFLGILLTIALGPLLFPLVWHNHYGKLAFGWGALTLAPMAAIYGAPTALEALVHAALAEYLSFMVLLFALYVVAGGVLVTGNLRGTPLVNTAILAFGTLIASVVSTTGGDDFDPALIRANAARLHGVHVIVFFIILVANVGGALSRSAIRRCSLASCAGSISSGRRGRCLRRPRSPRRARGLRAARPVVLPQDRLIDRGRNQPPMTLSVRGLVNLVLIAAIVIAIIAAPAWQPGVVFDVYGTKLELQNLVRDGFLLVAAGIAVAHA
jgi:Na+/H+ antiporter NhaD/arsenite permease-like protein